MTTRQAILVSAIVYRTKVIKPKDLLKFDFTKNRQFDCCSLRCKLTQIQIRLMS